ncbi:hypothetical protein LOD99_2773 [Oopsacas minuta]|uniref:Uncharacterized protein n=1 Tax=Oopsacas minuta TaxID=111878 RepID=A0AAV7K2F5_9METZ|nr:hypothetical protein LOD99_2773 [Oopsacas minuta]
MAAYESQRFSMLDTIIELETANKCRMLHSVILVAQIDPKIDSVYTKICSHYETLFAKLQKRYQCDAPTGLLLLYSNFSFHFIEAHHTIILHTIKDLQNLTLPSDNAFFTNSVILQYLSSVTYSLLPLWKYAILDIPPSGDESYQPSDSLGIVVGSVVRTFYKLISIYHKRPKTEAMRFLDRISDRIDLIVPREKLEYLLKQKELMTPNDFTKIVDKRHTTPLQSDVAWPAPERLFDV